MEKIKCSRCEIFKVNKRCLCYTCVNMSYYVNINDCYCEKGYIVKVPINLSLIKCDKYEKDWIRLIKENKWEK